MFKPLSAKEKKIINFIKKFDTPTIANSLEIIDHTLRDKGFTQKTMYCANIKLKPIAVSYTHLTLPTILLV